MFEYIYIYKTKILNIFMCLSDRILSMGQIELFDI